MRLSLIGGVFLALAGFFACDDGRAPSQAGIQFSSFQTEDPDPRYIFDFDAPLTTDRIRIEYLDSTGGNTGAKEIEFYEAL